MMKILLSILLIIVSSFFGFSQVGINTTDPDASAALDIVNDERGVLIPRMTTAQKNAIVDPAHSLLVYDTDLEGYYFNQGTPTTPNWVLLLTDVKTRDNYVIVKSVEDFPGGGQGGTITLDENTLYEVNGTISLSESIDVNGAYLIGKDTNEDVLNYTGSSALFTGSTNASFRNITFNNSGTGSLFNLTASSTNSLIAQSVVVNGFSSVGTVEGYGLVFFNVVQYIANSNGITYTDIGNLLLNNMGWQPSNGGFYETFTGTFGFIQKVSGFTTVGSGATGLDVSSDPTVGSGTLLGTVFSGAGTYVKPYDSGSGIYSGYNFNNNWTINSPGIKREEDDVATGNTYFSGSLNVGYSFSVTSNNDFSTVSTTTANAVYQSSNLFRVDSPSKGRLTYEGIKKRSFQINASTSVRVENADANFYAFFIAKNGSRVLGTDSTQRIINDTDVQSISISGTVELENGDYVEIWGKRLTGSGNDTVVIFSANMSIN